MLICALTGSIAMGKSTTSAMFRRHGVPVYDADATVHRLYCGRAAPLIEAEFPGSTQNGQVDRSRLSKLVLGDAERLARLETLVHALVGEEQRRFLEAMRGRRMVLLDIPLLFETGADRRADLTIVVTADQAVQRQRALARPDMSEEKLQAIVNRQMADRDKRQRAHFLIDTGHGLEAAERQVASILRALASML